MRQSDVAGTCLVALARQTFATDDDHPPVNKHDNGNPLFPIGNTSTNGGLVETSGWVPIKPTKDVL